MYWILFSVLRVLDTLFLAQTITFLGNLGFIHNILGYLGLNLNEFWILFKLVFLIFC